MAVSGSITEIVSTGGLSVSKENTLTGESRLTIDADVATAETDYEIAFVLDFSVTKMFYLNSTQDVTFETNNGAAADDTIDLLADKPYVFYDQTGTDAYHTFLIGTDITSIFITNTSGETATIRIETITDATP